MDEEDLISKIRILLIYGPRKVDGVDKDGEVEKIYIGEEKTAHCFYMNEFLQSHFKDEEKLQNAADEFNINTSSYIIQELGHVVFLENTSKPRAMSPGVYSKVRKSCVIYMPKKISQKQKKALEKLQRQLADEDYDVSLLYDLSKDEEENEIKGYQSLGKAGVLNRYTKEEMER